MAKLILANPQISIKYISNGKIIYHSPGNNNLLSAIVSIYGKDIIDQLILIDENLENNLSVYGYIGKPSLNRANRSHQSLLLINVILIVFYYLNVWRKHLKIKQ